MALSTEQRKQIVDGIICWDGGEWRVLSLGVEQDGKVLAHLSHTTMKRHQRNGANPIQINDWIPVGVFDRILQINDWVGVPHGTSR